MCERVVTTASAPELVGLFAVDLVSQVVPPPSWNVPAGGRVPIILDTIPRDEPDSEPVRRLEYARWGLVPVAARDDSAPATTARIATAAADPRFTGAIAARRAILPAAGYFQWTDRSGIRTPFFVSLPGSALVVFAAVYEWWRNPAVPNSPWVLTAAIMTTPAVGPLSELGDTMPVFLSPELVDEWLEPHEPGSEELLEGIADAAAEVAHAVGFHPVDPAVESPLNDSAVLLEPIPAG